MNILEQLRAIPDEIRQRIHEIQAMITGGEFNVEELAQHVSSMYQHMLAITQAFDEKFSHLSDIAQRMETILTAVSALKEEITAHATTAATSAGNAAGSASIAQTQANIATSAASAVQQTIAATTPAAEEPVDIEAKLDTAIDNLQAGEGRFDSPATTGLSFGAAIDLMRSGDVAMQRAGWNGKGMFVVCMPALQLPAFNTQDTARKVNDRTAKWIGPDTPLDCQPYFAMYTADKKWQPGWLASQTDMLATDWQIYGGPAAE